MAIHPSLRSKSKGRHRSVLKRFERVELLKKEGKWNKDTTVFGLPKVKIIRIKVKKEKAPEAAAAAAGAPAEGVPAPSAGAPAKAPAKKEVK